MQRQVWTGAVVLLMAVLLSLALSVPVLALSGEDQYGGDFVGGGGSGGSADSGDLNCPDFASQQEAQDFFEAQGGPAEDPHNLDADNDGQACEDSDFGGGGGGTDVGGAGADDGATPKGGVDSGFGPTAGPRVEGGVPPLAIGLVLVVLGMGLTAIVLRRRTD